RPRHHPTRHLAAHRRTRPPHPTRRRRRHLLPTLPRKLPARHPPTHAQGTPRRTRRPQAHPRRHPRPMNRQRLLPVIGFTLLAVCFAISLLRVFNRQRAESNPDEVIIRIAHWQLESGIRDAIDVLARDYERLHPGVRIQQNPIPERIYPSWLKTQLVGGTAPDLIQIGKGSDDETLARFFVPLTDQVEQPNPYNAGTNLAGQRWRDTFVDGLAGGDSYKPNLLEYYGVPLSMITIRMYYNVSEWQRILGDTPPPANYDEFISICERVQEHAAKTGRTIFPIAGSKYGTPWFASALIGS